MKYPWIAPFAGALMLAGCSDGTDDGSGGGAGDVLNPDAAGDVVILRAFAGVYDLTGNWRGDDQDAAFLVIREPTANGSAQAVLYDIDELENCSERPRGGDLFVDDFGVGVFLDNLNDFDEATVQLGNDGSLRLDFTDAQDIDGDGNRSERVAVFAPRVAITEQDVVEPTCR